MDRTELVYFLVSLAGILSLSAAYGPQSDSHLPST